MPTIKLTNLMKRCVAIVVLNAEHSLEIARFLKVSPAFVVKVDGDSTAVDKSKTLIKGAKLISSEPIIFFSKGADNYR